MNTESIVLSSFSPGGAEPVLGPTVDVLAVQEGPEVVAPVGQVGQEAVWWGFGSVQEIPWCTRDQLRSLIDVVAKQSASSGSRHRQRS